MKALQQIRLWAYCCVVNLSLAAVLGLLLRYKIAWPLPALNYKYLLNAHSHFAFNGWVTTVLFTAFVYILSGSGGTVRKTYRYLFWLNQLSSYGMLVSFTCQGYGPVSIFFSSFAVLFSYWFAGTYWLDLSNADLPSYVKRCMQAALVFLVLSSIGPYLLAYSMSHQIANMQFYYNAIYLYLHFQYNGWFTFGVFALFLFTASRAGAVIPRKGIRWFVWMMVAACVPAYTLSLLWTDPPGWVRVTAGVAGLVQCVALAVLTVILWRNRPKSGLWLSRPVHFLWISSYLAFALKIALQGLSAIPILGQLAFGNRPVIIAYLHLVMLCFVSFFILGFLIREGISGLRGPLARIGLWMWVGGVIGNELLLLTQSVLALSGHVWENSPFYLFGAAMAMSIGSMAYSLFLTRENRLAVPLFSGRNRTGAAIATTPDIRNSEQDQKSSRYPD